MNEQLLDLLFDYIDHKVDSAIEKLEQDPDLCYQFNWNEDKAWEVRNNIYELLRGFEQ